MSDWRKNWAAKRLNRRGTEAARHAWCGSIPEMSVSKPRPGSKQRTWGTRASHRRWHFGAAVPSRVKRITLLRKPGYFGLASVALLCSPALAYLYFSLRSKDKSSPAWALAAMCMYVFIRLAPSCDRYFGCSHTAPPWTDVVVCCDVGPDRCICPFDSGNQTGQSVDISTTHACLISCLNTGLHPSAWQQKPSRTPGKKSDAGREAMPEEPTTWHFLSNSGLEVRVLPGSPKKRQRGCSGAFAVGCVA
jgi:hypothetical protein